MNIDWNEINKGLEAELAKTASEPLEKEAFLGAAWNATKALGPLMLRGARAAAPYVASGIEGTGKVLGRAGDALNTGLGAGLQGVSRAGEALGGGANAVNDFVINSNAIGKGVDAARAAVPLAGRAVGGVLNMTGEAAGMLPTGLRTGMLAAATPALVSAVAPETHKKLLEHDSLLGTAYRLPGKAIDAAKGVGEGLGLIGDTATAASRVGADVLEGLNPNATQQAQDNPSPGFSDNMRSMRGNAQDLLGTATDWSGKLKRGLNWAKDTGRNLLSTGTQGINSYLGEMGDAGKYIPAIGGLLAGGLGAYLLSRKKPRETGYGGYGGMPAININVGGGGLQGRGMPPGFLNNDPTQVQSFGSYKQGSLLKGADIVDALSSAVGRRMADKVLNSAAGSGKESPQHEEHPKALEITSKHPHMTKLLKNKKNKEYLENLLKE